MTDVTGDIQHQLVQLSKNPGYAIALLQGKPVPKTDSGILNLILPYLIPVNRSARQQYLNLLQQQTSSNPGEEVQALWVEAAAYDAQENTGKAIEVSEQAVKKAQETPYLPQEMLRTSWMLLINRRLATRDPAQRHQADQEIEELAKQGKDDSLVFVLLTRAAIDVSSKGIDPGNLTEQQRADALRALEDVERAETCVVELPSGLISVAKAAVFKVLGRDEEDLYASKQAITSIQHSIPTTDVSPSQWSDLVEELAALFQHITNLMLHARPPRVREAIEWADKGKAQILRQQILWTSQRKSDTPQLLEGISYEELHALLAQEAAALALFDIGEQESWVFIVDPQEPEPHYYQIDLTSSELQKLLSQDRSQAQGIEELFKAVPSLAQKLLPSLRKVVEHNSMLYLVPGSQLYTFPFAALQFDDGEYLIKQCALAYIPSAAMLKWCLSRRKDRAEHTFLALGVGYTEVNKNKIYFAPQAEEVTEAVNILPGVVAKTMPETPTTEQFLNEAQHFSIIHLQCHGSLETSLDPLHASYIELADHMTVQQILKNRIN